MEKLISKCVPSVQKDSVERNKKEIKSKICDAYWRCGPHVRSYVGSHKSSEVGNFKSMNLIWENNIQDACWIYGSHALPSIETKVFKNSSFWIWHVEAIYNRMFYIQAVYSTYEPYINRILAIYQSYIHHSRL